MSDKSLAKDQYLPMEQKIDDYHKHDKRKMFIWSFIDCHISVDILDRKRTILIQWVNWWNEFLCSISVRME